MTSQEFGNVLLSHWQELWDLPASERGQRINEIADEIQYDEELQLVANEMGAAA
jgi:hypothetical protein